MPVLSFDISSGGISAAIFNSDLKTTKLIGNQWQIQLDESGSATLSLDEIVRAFEDLAPGIGKSGPVDAISIACFMHSIVLLDDDDRPLTPVFTWLDRRGESGVVEIRKHLGEQFHQRTGCRLHPMFPVFKLIALHLRSDPALAVARRAVSVKSAILKQLTGVWAEDYGMASASGLYNIVEDRWDDDILKLAGLRSGNLPFVSSRNNAIGHVTPAAARQFGIVAGTPVINGSGDGLLANTGSGCDSPKRIAVTLGTSASARQSLATPVLRESAGTFCYKADTQIYVLGCASNNGGNVLDWGRSMLGEFESNSKAQRDVPVFIPLLHGERSPEWNPLLTGSWHGLTSRHALPHLRQSVVEGVIFNLAIYIEILEQTSGIRAEQIVLSGNGFLNRIATSVISNLLPVATLFMPDPGLASLRGAAVCALRALGEEPSSAIGRLVQEAVVIPTVEDPDLLSRFQRYKELRGWKSRTLSIEH